MTIEFDCLVLEMSNTGEVNHRRTFRAGDAFKRVYGVKAGTNDIEVDVPGLSRWDLGR